MISSMDLLACAIDAAKAAGTHALKNRHRRNDVFKSERFDVKLMLDIECQALAENVIKKRFPDHDLLGEEDQSERERENAYEWIIDPIDGTVNFSHGLPLWCTSVAVRRDNDVMAGAVYAPDLDELYTATHEHASELNGDCIQVSDVSDMRMAMVTTGLNRFPDTPCSPFALLETLSSEVQKVRIMGSAALDLCRVANGHCEAYFETDVFIWDIAAAGLIVTQAGGRCERVVRETKHRQGFLGTNGLIHDQLKKVLTKVF